MLKVVRDNTVLVFTFALGLIIGAFVLLIFPGAFHVLRGLVIHDGQGMLNVGFSPSEAGGLEGGDSLGGPGDGESDPVRNALGFALQGSDRAVAYDALAERVEQAVFDNDAVALVDLAQQIRQAASGERERAAIAEAESGISDDQEAADGSNAEERLSLMQHRIQRRGLFQGLRQRSNAATQLLSKVDEESVEILRQLFHGAPEPDVRRDAALVLALSRTARAREILGEAMLKAGAGGEAESARLAATALGVSDDGPALALLVAAAGDDLDARVRVLACRSLVGCEPLARGEPGPVSQVLGAVLREDAESEVRAAAARAASRAGLAGLEPLRQALAHALRQDRDPTVRLAVLEALAENHRVTRETSGLLRDAILEQVGSNASLELRGQALRVLGESGDARAAEELEAMGAGLPEELTPLLTEVVEAIRRRIGRPVKTSVAREE